MVNKYFKAARALIFWMQLYCLICKPVPTTTAFQKRCQIYYKGELEQNSSLAMHHGHYANTTMEHISQSISSPFEMPLPNCLSCGEPHRAKEWGDFNQLGTMSDVSSRSSRFQKVLQHVSVSRLGARPGQNKCFAGDAPGILWSSRAFGKINAGAGFSRDAGFLEAAAPRAIIGPVMYDCHLPH